MGTRKNQRFFVSQKAKPSKSKAFCVPKTIKFLSISVRSKNLKDELRYKIVSEELEKVNELIKGHEKLLRAIGNL